MRILNNHFLFSLLGLALLLGCRNDDELPEVPCVDPSNPECPNYEEPCDDPSNPDCANYEEPCDDPSNPECPNYDPCTAENPTSADFVIEQKWSQAPDSLSYVGGTDKFTGGIIRFSALDQNAWTYTWYLGVEVIGNQSIERDFSNVPFGSMITVSLVITKAPADQGCFPDDDGRDSIAKNFFIMNPCDFLINNKLKGTYAHAPLDTVIIELLFDDPNSSGCNGSTFSAFNLGNSGEWKTGVEFPDAVNNRLYVAGNGGASPKGYLIINEETEEAIFTYQYSNLNWDFKGNVFD